jgi:transposase
MTSWPKYWLTYWLKSWLIPAPPLVGIELNPGPSAAERRREQIVLLQKTKKFTQEEIANQLGCSERTVRNVLKRISKKKKKKVVSMKNKPGQGRKRKLTAKEEKTIAKKAKKGKEARELAREKGNIEETSIRRALKRQGLKYLVRKKREKLTQDQIERRLAFAQKRLKDDWKYAFFTDEKDFQLGSTRHKSWQDPNDRVTEEFKRHPQKLHVWGGIGKHFKTDLYFFHENLNAKLMCKILNKKGNLPPAYVYDLPPHLHNKCILVQDNDPKHRSKMVTQLLDKKAPNRVLDFPANSPDFNPIEDIWSIIASALERKNIKKMSQLKRAIKNEWDKLDMQLIRNSVESMPRRLQECINLKGERTSY